MRGRLSNTKKSPTRAKRRRKILRFIADRDVDCGFYSQYGADP
jgi:hypothetical protein